MFDRILVPLDGSALAERVLDQLPLVGADGPCELVLVRALDPGPSIYLDDPLTGQTIQPAIDAMQANARRYLDEVSARMDARGHSVTQVIEAGPAAEVVLRAAETHAPALIAMSSHGRGGMSRWLLGSVAEKVARAIRVPLFLTRSYVVADGALVDATVAERPVTIVVAVDATEGAPAAAPLVAWLAGKFEARVVLLHVGDDTTAGPVLDAAADRLAAAGCVPTRVHRTGHVADQIVGYCREYPADLLVVGSHGAGGAKEWVLGATAQRVLHRSPVPLLVVREGA